MDVVKSPEDILKKIEDGFAVRQKLNTSEPIFMEVVEVELNRIENVLKARSFG